MRSRHAGQKFFKNVKRLTEGFKPGASSCRDDRSNLVTDAQGVRFCEAKPATGEVSEPAPIDADWVGIPPRSLNEVRVAILKNNKAAEPDALTAELLKAGGDELVRSLQQLICRIWLEESMPSDCNLSALCSVLKKGDSSILFVLSYNIIL